MRPAALLCSSGSRACVSSTSPNTLVSKLSRMRGNGDCARFHAVIGADAGVIDKYIELAVSVGDMESGCLKGSRQSHVDVQKVGLLANGGRSSLARRLVTRSDQHLVAKCSELLGRFQSKAFVRARDQRYFPVGHAR